MLLIQQRPPRPRVSLGITGIIPSVLFQCFQVSITHPVVTWQPNVFSASLHGIAEASVGAACAETSLMYTVLIFGFPSSLKRGKAVRCLWKMLGLETLKGKCFERPGRSPSWPKASISTKADGLKPSSIELSLKKTVRLWTSWRAPRPQNPFPGADRQWVGSRSRSYSSRSQNS